jgi:hypothetical protein
MMLLQHDNAKPHTDVTSVAIETISFEVVLHALYSPDLELSDFFLFGAFKKHLKSTRFTYIEEFQAAVAKKFQQQPKTFCTDRFNRLVQC